MVLGTMCSADSADSLPPQSAGCLGKKNPIYYFTTKRLAVRRNQASI